MCNPRKTPEISGVVRGRPGFSILIRDLPRKYPGNPSGVIRGYQSGVSPGLFQLGDARIDTPETPGQVSGGVRGYLGNLIPKLPRTTPEISGVFRGLHTLVKFRAIAYNSGRVIDFGAKNKVRKVHMACMKRQFTMLKGNKKKIKHYLKD